MTELVLPVLGETLDAKPPEYSSKMGKRIIVASYNFFRFPSVAK